VPGDKGFRRRCALRCRGVDFAMNGRHLRDLVEAMKASTSGRAGPAGPREPLRHASGDGLAFAPPSFAQDRVVHAPGERGQSIPPFEESMKEQVLTMTTVRASSASGTTCMPAWCRWPTMISPVDEVSWRKPE